MRETFDTLCDHVLAGLAADEQATLWYDGEQSDFVRFNRGRVRQPGTVRQGSLKVRLIRGAKNVTAEVSVGGAPDEDRGRLDALVGQLRDALPLVPDDPHLLWNPDGESVEEVEDAEPIDATAVVDEVLSSGGDADLVGILASGPIASGYASSTGTRSWFQKSSWSLDWCLYHQGDKAVKSTVAGTTWDPDALSARMWQAREQLRVLARPVKRLEPGEYRAYLTPAAVQEIFEILSWNSFGLKNTRTHQSGLQRLADGSASLSPRVTLSENLREGTAPGFQADGFRRAPRTTLIAGGHHAGSLVSPRSAMEFDVPTTGANRMESPDALDLAAGDLAEADVLDALGTGLYVSNLWYLNYSDRPAGRLTGMTRFATMWVEDGEVVAPAEVMRFDDTVYNLLGEHLEALTTEREFMMDTGTYFLRGTRSWRLPGALVGRMAFTL